jgi:Dolichyl-phosphate-mannose-protein mannosyltransferase
VATITLDGVPQRVRFQWAVLGAVLVLAAVRLICAGLVPLSLDESLYWLWSKHIAGGYLDHPPVNPILIRLGTTLFGDTEFGVRSMGVLLSLSATWAIWRAATILFDDINLGARAALYFNLTFVVAGGSAIMTPDGAVVATTAFLLLALAKLEQTDRGEWWLVIGLVFGIGMLSKYTTIFFAVSILAWLLLVPKLRKYLLTPWPWISGAIAVAVFSPTLIWNEQHGWASFVFQSHRLVVHEWTARYLGEFLLTQAAIATAPIFVLGAMGLAALLRSEAGPQPARVLLSAMVWPLLIYFAWHSLHERIEGNWPEPIYVAFVIAAAVAAERIEWKGAWAAIAEWSQRLAVPVGIGMAGLVYLQGVFGIVPLGHVDPSARIFAVGFKDTARKLDDIRSGLGAPIVLTTDYGLAGWLKFYLPSHPPVEQINQRMRFVDAPQPDPALFQGTVMYVCEVPCYAVELVSQRFETVEAVATLPRTRRGVTIDDYMAYRLSGPRMDPLDPPTRD